MGGYFDEKLQDAVERHGKWLAGEEGGERLVLKGADLSGADLSHQVLTRAVLRDVNLTGAYLEHVVLNEADLIRANLKGAAAWNADFSGAELKEAVLADADVSKASFNAADLSRADMRGAFAQNAHLNYAHLSDTRLAYADLRYANLEKACVTQRCDWYGAKLSGAKVPAGVAETLSIVPASGFFEGYKKVLVRDADGRPEFAIAHLQIGERSARSNSTGRLCRCEHATVTRIESCDGASDFERAEDCDDAGTVYELGETVSCKGEFDPDRWNESGCGITFFLTRGEAVAWKTWAA